MSAVCGSCHAGGKSPSIASGAHDVHGANLADQTSCYPCHRLHMGMAFCREDGNTGCAACQADIAPPRVFEAIGRHYDEWATLRALRKAA